MKTCACVIPFYNEGERIVALLTKLSRAKYLTQIICVDDGSSDKTYHVIKKKFPQVTILRNNRNLGKSAAILRGLREIQSDYVFLIDGDLSNIHVEEIDSAIHHILSDQSVDMIVLRRKNDPWFSKLVRGEVLASGERILHRRDLVRVFSNNPTGYQIEFAINFYMMKHKKSVYWVTFSGKNIPKIKKLGVVKGLTKELQMYKRMIQYGGYTKTIHSFLTFCTDEYKSRAQ